MIKKILFVDDEEKILHGLQRSLYSLKGKYELYFELSGNEALELMKTEKIDVIVTDMRMPEMNGLQLLEKVKGLYPETVRIILSGYSDRDMVLKSIELAHQYLSKPCDIEILKVSLYKAIEIRKILEQEDLRIVLSKLKIIPSMPNLYLKLLGELSKEKVSLDVISETISSDLGMSAKILQVVNSHFFGTKNEVTNIKEAVGILGFDVIKSLVLSIDVFDKFNQDIVPEFSIDKLLKHSIGCAKLSKQIALLEKKDEIFINNSFLAGMLHDIGILIIASNLPEKYKNIYNLILDNKVNMHQAEKEILNATHSEIGGYLVKLWGLPDDIVNAILFHHNPLKSSIKDFSILSVVHIANYLYYEIFSNNEDSYKSNLDEQYVENLDLKGKIEEWKKISVDNN